MDRSFLAGLQSGVEIRVSQFVPEMVQPPPCKTIGEVSRGRRTDFGRHFRVDSFTRGSAAPALVPTLGYFMLDGVCHMHPNVYALFLEAIKKPFKRTQPLLYMDGI